MMATNILSSLTRTSARVFGPVRALAGPFHRRRPSGRAKGPTQEEGRLSEGGNWAADGCWCPTGFPPRPNNLVRPLIHGDTYFADLCEVLSGARERVTIAGWSLTPLMSLRRQGDAGRDVLAEVLKDVSERADVYVLLWSGAPALFEPTVHLVAEARRTILEVAPRVRCELDHHASFSHDHHQKAVTIDGRVAYVGGIDLTTFQGDRWDTAAHPLRHGPNWHDVQVRLEGDVVQDVETNFCQRWNAVTGEGLQALPAPPADPKWNTPAQVVRTVPAGFYPFVPDGEYGIRHAILHAIRGAQRFIYLENQYIWSPEVVEALCDVMDRRSPDSFRVVLVLPARAYTGRYDNDRHVQLLREADAGRGMFEAYTLYSSGPAFGRSGYAYLPIYVHAKVGIIDDQWFTIGSANLNRRGLATDTEMSVQAIDAEVATALRANLWAEHLGMTPEEVSSSDPIRLIDGAWKSRAQQLEECFQRASPPSAGHLLRYSVSRSPQSRVLDLIQDLTLEH